VFLFIDLCVDNFPYCHAHIVVAYEVTSIIVPVHDMSWDARYGHKGWDRRKLTFYNVAVLSANSKDKYIGMTTQQSVK
jgi:hypothetical protein